MSERESRDGHICSRQRRATLTGNVTLVWSSSRTKQISAVAHRAKSECSFVLNLFNRHYEFWISCNSAFISSWLLHPAVNEQLRQPDKKPAYTISASHGKRPMSGSGKSDMRSREVLMRDLPQKGQFMKSRLLSRNCSCGLET